MAQKFLFFPRNFYILFLAFFTRVLIPDRPICPYFRGFSGFSRFFRRFFGPLLFPPHGPLSSWCPGFCLSGCWCLVLRHDSNLRPSRRRASGRERRRRSPRFSASPHPTLWSPRASRDRIPTGKLLPGGKILPGQRSDSYHKDMKRTSRGSRPPTFNNGASRAKGSDMLTPTSSSRPPSFSSRHSASSAPHSYPHSSTQGSSAYFGPEKSSSR